MFLHKVLLLLFFFSVLAADSLLAQPLNNKIDDPRYRFLKSTGVAFLRSDNLGSLPDDFEPDLTIDLRTIDTSLYSSLYTLWSEIPIGYSLPLIIGDANSDDREEIYGTYKSYQDPNYYRIIFEINEDGSYDSVYRYPDTLGMHGNMADLDNDGSCEAVNRSYYSDSLGWYLLLLSTDSLTGYPTTFTSAYDTSTGNGQPAKINFYDIDGDSYPEMIYYYFGIGDSIILSNSDHIAEYDRNSKTFHLVQQNHPPTYYTAGYSFGDFDSDGKQNFSTGSIWGEIFVYEHVSGNNYEMIRIDSLPAKHAYMSTFTNDINHDGRPELWIGAEAYINNVGSTILFVYEATGDNTYEIVYTIAIVGVISFYASNMLHADFDNDCNDEVLVCIDQHVLVFKNIGHGYELYYLKRNDYINQNSVYYSAISADFDRDNYPEIVISQDLVENEEGKLFSRIYKKTSTMDVNEGNYPPDYYIKDPYPNPFNPSTTIEFFYNKSESLKITIYDILGREIKILMDDYIREGHHSVNWDGTDEYGKKVSSGMYLITFKSNSLNKTLKTVLLK